MVKWEYKNMQSGHRRLQLDLNELGNEGWEVYKVDTHAYIASRFNEDAEQTYTLWCKRQNFDISVILKD